MSASTSPASPPRLRAAAAPPRTSLAAAVEGGERGQRRPEVAELAVVVVLDDESVGAASPVEQLEACRDGKPPAERVLVARRHHDGVRRSGHPSQRGDDEAVGVDGDRRRAGAPVLENATSRRVAGVLDGDRGRAAHEVAQRGGHECDGVARAGGDDHVVGGAGDAAGVAEVVRDLGTQSRHAEGRRRLGGDLLGRGMAPGGAPGAGVDARRRRPAGRQVHPRDGRLAGDVDGRMMGEAASTSRTPRDRAVAQFQGAGPMPLLPPMRPVPSMRPVPPSPPRRAHSLARRRVRPAA